MSEYRGVTPAEYWLPVHYYHNNEYLKQEKTESTQILPFIDPIYADKLGITFVISFTIPNE